jgi:hypothetical protein
VDFIRLAYLPWLILQPSVASTVIFYEFPHEPLALLSERFYREKLSAICVKEKFLNNTSHIHLTTIVINYHDRNNALQIFKRRLTHSPIVASSVFRWKSLRGWDFRPQLVVVSGLFGGNPFVDGILGHNLLLSQAFFLTFIYQEAFLTNFFFFTMEFWLSRSLSLELFSFFTMEFWLPRSLSHGLFSFFTMEFWLSRSLSLELFSFFTMEF